MTTAESSPGVTVETSNNNSDQSTATSATEPIATQARAQARARLSLSDSHRELFHLWAGQAGATFRRLSGWLEGNQFLREHPASPAAMLAYAKDAPMAGGSRALKIAQRVDAYLLAMPIVLALYALAWIWLRPLRRGVFLLVVAAIWLLH